MHKIYKSYIQSSQKSVHDHHLHQPTVYSGLLDGTPGRSASSCSRVIWLEERLRQSLRHDRTEALGDEDASSPLEWNFEPSYYGKVKFPYWFMYDNM